MSPIIFQTIVYVPKEECDLRPHEVCSQSVKMTPYLTQETKCSMVPREVCSEDKVARLEKKTIKKIVCDDNKTPGKTYHQHV